MIIIFTVLLKQLFNNAVFTNLGQSNMDSSNLRPIVIIGAATALLEVYDLVEDINNVKPQYKIIGALDDDSNLHGKSILGIPIIGGLSLASSLKNVSFVFAISSYKLRIKRIELFNNLGISADQFITLIHPLADISATASIGRGCTIYSGAVVGAKAQIGDFTLIYNLSFISPYAQMSAFSMVAALAYVGAHATLAIGAFIAGKAAIAAHCHLGIGAMIAFGSIAFENIPHGEFARGNPAVLTGKQISIPDNIIEAWDSKQTEVDQV